MEVMERTATGLCPTLPADRVDICATRNDLDHSHVVASASWRMIALR